MLRVIRLAAVAAAALVAGAAALVFGGSALVLSRAHALPVKSFAAAHDAARVAEGSRLAKIAFCKGCHGANGEGSDVDDDPSMGSFYAPALASRAALYDDARLARAIRHGVAGDGHAMYVMPVRLFNGMADDDLADVIGWIRTLKPTVRDEMRPLQWTLKGRLSVLDGAYPSALTPADTAPAHRPADAGRYLVRLSCLQCHALHQEKALGPKDMAPALADVGAAYDPAAFRRLIRTGASPAAPDLGWMTWAAKNNLHYLTDTEIDQIKAYLAREQAHPTEH